MPSFPLPSKKSFLTVQSMKSSYIGVEMASIFPSRPIMAPRSGSITLFSFRGLKKRSIVLSGFQKYWMVTILATRSRESRRKPA